MSVKYRKLAVIVKNQVMFVGTIVLMIFFVGRNVRLQNLEAKVRGKYYFFV